MVSCVHDTRINKMNADEQLEQKSVLFYDFLDVLSMALFNIVGTARAYAPKTSNFHSR